MGNSNLEQQSNSSNTHWAWFWMILAVLYSVSPIDIIPDFIPLAGWADDILGLGISGLNLLQVYTAKSNAALSAILKILKWNPNCINFSSYWIFDIQIRFITPLTLKLFYGTF